MEADPKEIDLEGIQAKYLSSSNSSSIILS